MSELSPRAALLRRVGVGVEAATALTTAYIATRLLGPARLMRMLGSPQPAVTAQPGVSGDWRPARRIARAVDRVADALPWRPVCLPRAVATRTLLRRRGIPCELHLGIAGTAPLAAHAWVTAGGRVVQGGPVRHVTPLAVLR
jgi:hypothetical protein